MATSQGLECPVCCESFDGQDVSPRMLSCGHSFCTGCLERLLAADDKITCPKCRVDVNVPQAGVAGLPKNWALLSLIAPDHEGVDGLPICEFCENKHPANSYCLDCEEDMCKNAARFHTRNKTSRDHRIVSLEPSAVSVKCPRHDEQFRLFDVKRNCMICRSCFTSFRGRHVMSLAEAGSKCKEKFEELATKARSRAEVIKAAEEGVRDVSLDVKESCDEQRARIKSVFKETTMASAEVPECPICRELYDHQDLCPRLLICGHTFCTSCLEKLVKNNSISCPDCRKKTSVPTGVAGLTKNYALLKIGNTTPQDVEGLHNCEECETKHPATSWCLDCDYDMCKTAAHFHTRNKASRDHKIVSLEQLAVSVFCSEHKEQFRLFDAECNHMVCKNCVTLTHKNHRLLSLADVGSKYKQEMETLASQASARAELHDAITTREQDLMNELETLHREKAAILTKQRARLANCQDCIKATVQSVLSTIQSSDNANILYVRSAVESTLEAATENQYLLLEPEAQFVPEFTRCDERKLQRVVVALSNVGVVVDKSTCAETTTAAGSGLEHANPGEVASFTITARDAKNRARDLGGDTFEVQLKNELEDKVSADVQDKGDGNYLVTYTIPRGAKRVDYELSVLLRGAPIQGSPFTVHMASSLRRKTYKVLSDVASKITQH